MSTILTVDDSKMIRTIIANTVVTLGYDVLEAPDAEKALGQLEAHADDIRLILLDWNMPGMNGLDLLIRIKSIENYRHIPVMMVTTEGERKNVIRALQAGAAHYLTKPFIPEDLATKIIECIGMAETHPIHPESSDLEL